MFMMQFISVGLTIFFIDTGSYLYATFTAIVAFLCIGTYLALTNVIQCFNCNKLARNKGGNWNIYAIWYCRHCDTKFFTKL